MLILALSVAGCAAYFSVWGLSQLFAGASTAVIIMASVLEIGKVVTTTALHTYWSKLANGLKVYLTISVGVLMIITSAGIYGFLSNAYQSTANKLELHEGELGVLEAKKLTFEKTIADNQKIIDSKTKRVDQLSNLRTSQESRLDNSTSRRSQRSARADIESANIEVQKLNTEIDGLNAKNIVLSDSVNAYNVKMIEVKSGSEIAGEIGPLKYISELTGAPMAKVVNFMILLLIFVFDPLAIALVLATNRVFELEGKQTPLEPKIDKTKEVLEDVVEELKKQPEVPTTIVDVIKSKTSEDDELPIEEPIMLDEQHEEDIVEEVEEVKEAEIEPWDIRPIQEEIVVEEPIVEEIKPIAKKQPVIPTGKVELEDIKEIKEGNRGFSVEIPNPKTSNTIERIGSNKIVKNGDNNKVYFKRG